MLYMLGKLGNSVYFAIVNTRNGDIIIHEEVYA